MENKNNIKYTFSQGVFSRFPIRLYIQVSTFLNVCTSDFSKTYTNNVLATRVRKDLVLCTAVLITASQYKVCFRASEGQFSSGLSFTPPASQLLVLSGPLLILKPPV